MHYYVTYLADCYILADAFRPEPGWGSRVMRVDAATLPPHTEEEIIQAAQVGTPDGYWLQKVEAVGPGTRRGMLSVPVPVNHQQAAERKALRQCS